jgi:hypothetical protein
MKAIIAGVVMACSFGLAHAGPVCENVGEYCDALNMSVLSEFRACYYPCVAKYECEASEPQALDQLAKCWDACHIKCRRVAARTNREECAQYPLFDSCGGA